MGSTIQVRGTPGRRTIRGTNPTRPSTTTACTKNGSRVHLHSPPIPTVRTVASFTTTESRTHPVCLSRGGRTSSISTWVSIRRKRCMISLARSPLPAISILTTREPGLTRRQRTSWTRWGAHSRLSPYMKTKWWRSSRNSCGDGGGHSGWTSPRDIGIPPHQLRRRSPSLGTYPMQCALGILRPSPRLRVENMAMLRVEEAAVVPLFLVEVSVNYPCFELLLGLDFRSWITITITQHHRRTTPRANRWTMSIWDRDRHNPDPISSSSRQAHLNRIRANGSLWYARFSPPIHRGLSPRTGRRQRPE